MSAAEPQPLGPRLWLGDHEVRVGTCSWTDPTLVKETDWYPRKSMSAAQRLAFYAEHFPLVEADSTYYRPPSRDLTAGWASRSPAHFEFDIKAYSLFTHHPTRPETLWPDVRAGIRPEFAGKRNAYVEHLDPAAVGEAWARFGDGLQPLVTAGKLGTVLFQYPEWFTPKRANRDELACLPEHLPSTRICVEFRSPRWLAEDDRDRTLDVLRANGLALVVVDAPRAAGLPMVLAATRDDVAVVRMHGRADATWKQRGVTAAERFKYLYRRDELEPWVDNVAALARDAEQVHVLMNNCYRDYGVRNADDMLELLVERGAVPA
ncbi:MAG TPA: DUF72 domain-containing protein [Acidimicrobiia bacterium]|nr:DUF72 domain-containing protein [Acidimicrobiia bacterium]